MYNIELPQNFASNLNEKRHQVALLVRKAKSKDKNENISTGESLPGCLLYTSPSPRDGLLSRMPSSA